MRALGRFERKFDPHRPWPHRVQLVLSADNMNTKVSGRESLNGAAEPGRDLLEIDVFDGTKSVRAKNRCDANRLETADRTFINFLGNSGFIVGEKARNGVPFLPVLILSERSSPSRVRFPAPKKRRALDCCGPL